MRIRDDADERVERTADEPRNREHEADLRVAERQIVANQRPRSGPCAPDELVEELDCEQDDNDAGNSAPAQDPELAGRARAVHYGES